MPQLEAADFAPQLIWLAIVFIGLYIALAFFALPRLGSIIETRKSRIENDLAEAGRLKDAAEAALKTYEAALAEARAKAQTIAREARDKANAEMEARKTEIAADIARRASEAEDRIAKAKSAAMSSMRGAAAEAAAAAVERLIGQKVAAADAKSAVDAAGR